LDGEDNNTASFPRGWLAGRAFPSFREATPSTSPSPSPSAAPSQAPRATPTTSVPTTPGVTRAPSTPPSQALSRPRQEGSSLPLSPYLCAQQRRRRRRVALVERERGGRRQHEVLRRALHWQQVHQPVGHPGATENTNPAVGSVQRASQLVIRMAAHGCDWFAGRPHSLCMSAAVSPRPGPSRRRG